MDASRFDDVSRFMANGFSRRRLLVLLGGVGALFLPAGRLPAAARTGAVTCPKVEPCPTGFCWTCQYHEDGDGCSCKCLRCGLGGIAGGGSVPGTNGAEAIFSLMATRQGVEGQAGAFDMVGQVRWMDPGWGETGLTMEAPAVSFYGPIPDLENGREILGTLESAQFPEPLPFVLQAVAANLGEVGTATVALWVGDAILDDPTVAATFDPVPARTGFGYAAAGSLATGDLQLLSLAAIGEDNPEA